MRWPRELFFLLLSVSLLAGSGRTCALDIRIAVFHEQLVDAFLFTPGDGDYRVATEQGNLWTCPARESWYVVRQKDSLVIRDHTGKWHKAVSLRFMAPDEYAYFRLKPAMPVLDSREYMTDLLVEVSMNSLLMINKLDVERYIMGVVETEAGYQCDLEYYKVQSILSRTFAFRNPERHATEGFNLCDAVHCQAYKGRNLWSEDVEIGTEVTNGLVLVDEDSLLINAAYHANSGGETRGAEQIWLNGKSYLRPVLDPFSLNQPAAKWQKAMPVDDWIRYLREKGVFVGELADTAALEFPVRHRQDYYLSGQDSLLFSVIRDDFKLRSDFFSVKVDGKQVILDGKGYGHGVGLSQEGAMEMARKGYHYTAILNYYYHRIQIIHYNYLEEAGKGIVDIINLP